MNSAIPLVPRAGRRLALAALLVNLCLCGTAQALTQSFQSWADTLGLDMTVEYKAKRVITTEGNSFEYSERRAPQKLVMDMNMEGVAAVLLVREDLAKSYVLMPGMGMYREMPMDKANQQAGGVNDLEEVTKVGRETVNGYECTKFKARIRNKEGKGDALIWVADNGVPIKMDMVFSSRRKRGQRMVMELKELQLGTQDPAYFELPADLKPFGLGGLGKLFQR